MGTMVQLPSDMLKLDVLLCGQLEKVNDVISKCRVSIFYKGMNRNHTFISDDFANQLIQSLPYVPIKGIYDYAGEDYLDHGDDNSDGKIYGIVPENPNFDWEKHCDKDGVEREYGCCDVYLFTALYDEAGQIPEKGQSMEIYRETLDGEWRISEFDGNPFFYFKKGSLLGLQVLGNGTEPCFEGAKFYSLYKGANELLDYIKKHEKKEEKKMEITKELFKHSENENWDCLFDALNPDFTAEKGYKVSYSINAIYDTYALCQDVEDNFKKVNYTKTENGIEIGDIADTYVMEVSESEKSALEAMKSETETYEKANEEFSKLKEDVDTYSTKIAELEATVAEKEKAIEDCSTKYSEAEQEIETLKTTFSEKEAEIEALKSEKSVLENEKADITSERDALADFKRICENEKKEAILSEFSTHLNDEQITSFKDTIDKYSVEDFEKEVCMTAYKSDKEIFSKQEPDMIYKNESQHSKFENGAIRLLENYKNGGNK